MSPPTPSVRRGRATALMLAAFVVGLVLMVAFEGVLARVLGVLALFTFIVTGVFVVADPAFLGQEEDGEDARAASDR